MQQEEFFDIVDEENRPIGIKKSRSEVHNSKAYWHRATHIWILNREGSILCQQRSLTKDVYPGKWQSFFGGHLKSGQSYDENCSSELEEELGITVNKNDLRSLYVLKNEPSKHFGQVYVMAWNGRIEDLRFNDKEVEKVKWFTSSELKVSIASGEFCNRFDPEVEKILLEYDRNATARNK
jgi:isopentenyl-diphosphate delta-isomerase type 1